jgi:hypothetical protein
MEIVLNVLTEYNHVMLDQIQYVSLDSFHLQLEFANVILDLPQLLMEQPVELVQQIVFHVLLHHNVPLVNLDSPFNRMDNAH